MDQMIPYKSGWTQKTSHDKEKKWVFNSVSLNFKHINLFQIMNILTHVNLDER